MLCRVKDHKPAQTAVVKPSRSGQYSLISEVSMYGERERERERGGGGEGGTEKGRVLSVFSAMLILLFSD